MSFGNTPTTTTQGALPTNQIPLGEVYVPEHTNGDAVALQGGPSSTDSHGNESAPIATYTPNGNDVTQGLKADTAATDSTSSWSAIALLKGLYAKLASTLTISGAVTTSGTVTEANSAASKADLDTIVTNTNKIPASPATEGGNLATLAGGVTSSKYQSNVAQINGVAPTMGNGISGTGVQRVTIASDSTGQVTANAGTNLNTSLLALESGGNLATLAGAIAAAIMQANVKQINGITPLMGNGVTGTGSQRVTIASDNTAFSTNAVQSGTWTVQPGNTANTTPWLTQEQAGTAGGSTFSHTISASGTNATNLKNAAGMVYGFSISNSNASARFFRLYNTSTAPTVGTTASSMTVQVPGNSTVIRVFPVGLVFGTGISWGLSTGIADNDTGAVGTDISVDIDYK